MQTTHMQNVVANTASLMSEREPLTMKKRVGSTTYVVSVRFGAKCAETLEDKILRLIKQEVSKSA